MSTCRNTTAKGERMLWEKQNFSVKNLLFLFALMLCYLLAFWSPCVLQLYFFFSKRTDGYENKQTDFENDFSPVLPLLVS